MIKTFFGMRFCSKGVLLRNEKLGLYVTIKDTSIFKGKEDLCLTCVRDVDQGYYMTHGSFQALIGVAHRFLRGKTVGELKIPIAIY